MTDKPIPMQQGDTAPGPGCFVPLVLHRGNPMCGQAGVRWITLAREQEQDQCPLAAKVLLAIDAALREAAKGRPLQVGDKVMVGDAEATIKFFGTETRLPYLVEWPKSGTDASWLPAAAVRRADG